MNVKPMKITSREPLSETIRQLLALEQELEAGEWVDIGDLLAEPSKPLSWYKRAWNAVRRGVCDGRFRCKHGVLWWLRYRTTHRYNVVQTGLAPGYYDKDTLMLHASFNLLVDFVEHECGGAASLETEAKWGGRHGEMATECLALYWWWTVIRPSRRDEYKSGMEAVYDAKDDEMLARLVKVRRWLWT